MKANQTLTGVLVLILILVGGGIAFIQLNPSGNEKVTNTQDKTSDNNQNNLEQNSNASQEDSENSQKFISNISKLNNEEIKKEVNKLKKNEISIKNFEKNYIMNEKGTIGELYKKLKDNFYKNLSKNTKRNYSNGKNKTIRVSVNDSEGNPINNAKIYLWGMLVGQTNNDGKLETSINIPENIHYYKFSAKKEGYTWGFKRKNSIYGNSSLVLLSFSLKKTEGDSFEVENVDNFSKKGENLSVSTEGKKECLTKKANGQCYQGKAKITANRIEGGENPEVYDLSVPRRGIRDGEIVNLATNGMAFVNFYDENGNRLIYNKNKKIRICYKIPEEDLENWRNRRRQLGENMEGYWWFDKKVGYWKFGEANNTSLKGNKRCFTTSNIY